MYTCIEIKIRKGHKTNLLIIIYNRTKVQFIRVGDLFYFFIKTWFAFVLKATFCRVKRTEVGFFVLVVCPVMCCLSVDRRRWISTASTNNRQTSIYFLFLPNTYFLLEYFILNNRWIKFKIQKIYNDIVIHPALKYCFCMSAKLFKL